MTSGCRSRGPSHKLLLLGLFATLVAVSTGQAQHIEVANTATYVGSGRYDWTIFLLAAPEVLDQISYVEYTLHPSFPNPVRRSYERETGFALRSNGWGEFNAFLRVFFHDGRQVHLEHWVSLEKRTREEFEAFEAPEELLAPEPGLELPEVIEMPAMPERWEREVTAANTARHLGEHLWEWTVFIRADEQTLSEIAYVEYVLHPTFPEPIRRVYTKENGFALTARGWGTFEIEIGVAFRDGDVRHLTHMLQF